MTLLSKNIVLMMCMFAAAGFAIALHPTHRVADDAAAVDLAVLMPKAFGDWHEDIQSGSYIVDPRKTAFINSIYSQTLSRTYVNSEGYRIMLALAYQRDQSSGLQVHKPEVCYPSQGFQVRNIWDDEIVLTQGTVPVRRIEANLGNVRNEPISYWTMVGKTAVVSETRRKFVQLEYAFKGQVPDGLLFRVSSIDADAKTAFQYQNKFIQSLVTSVSPLVRSSLSGL